MTDLTVIRLVATPMPARSSNPASPERANAAAPCAPAAATPQPTTASATVTASRAAATAAPQPTTASATGTASLAAATPAPGPTTAPEIASHNLSVQWALSPFVFAGVALQLMMLVLAVLIFLRNQKKRQLRELGLLEREYTSLRRGPMRILVSIPLQVPLALFAAFLLLTIPFGVQLTPHENYADVLGLRLTMTPPGWQIVDATCRLTIVFLAVWLFRFVWEPSYDVWSIITRGDGAGERPPVYSVVDTIARRALMIIGGLVLTFTGLAFANGIVSSSNPPRPVEPRESPRLVGSVSPFWQTFEATFNAPRTLGKDESAVVSVGFRMQRSHESTWLAHESKFGPKRIGHGKYHAYLVAPAFRVDDVAADPVDVRYTGTTCWSWTIQPKREGLQVIQAVIEHDVNGHRQTRWESVGSNIEVPHRIAAETWLKSSAPFLTFALGFLSIVLGLFTKGGGRDARIPRRRRQAKGAEEDSYDNRFEFEDIHP